MGQDVYRATDFEILPLSPHVNISHPQHPVESHLVGLVKTHLRTGFFLFSYGFDLTRRLQAQWETREQDAGKAMWEVVSANQSHLPIMFSQSHRRMTGSSGTSKNAVTPSWTVAKPNDQVLAYQVHGHYDKHTTGCE